MKGIVWYNNFESGLEKITQIKKDYIRYGIEVSKEGITSHSATIYFKNGDIWTMVNAKDSARGHCCNISYIQRSIPTDIVEQIIKPCTKAFPYRAYNYYGEVDSD